MTVPPKSLRELIDRAKSFGAIRVAVASAAQDLIIETVREALDLALIEPRLIGEPYAIRRFATETGWELRDDWIVPAESDNDAATQAIALARDGEADAVMKGRLHTDILMHALLDEKRGLRVPGRRVSHIFVAELRSYPKLLGITDAAINIVPDLSAKAQILQSAISLFAQRGVDRASLRTVGEAIEA